MGEATLGVMSRIEKLERVVAKLERAAFPALVVDLEKAAPVATGKGDALEIVEGLRKCIRGGAMADDVNTVLDGIRAAIEAERARVRANDDDWQEHLHRANGDRAEALAQLASEQLAHNGTLNLKREVQEALATEQRAHRETAATLKAAGERNLAQIATVAQLTRGYRELADRAAKAEIERDGHFADCRKARDERDELVRAAGIDVRSNHAGAVAVIKDLRATVDESDTTIADLRAQLSATQSDRYTFLRERDNARSDVADVQQQLQISRGETAYAESAAEQLREQLKQAEQRFVSTGKLRGES
jgi:hypothetical protein